VPREMLFKVLARLGFPPKIIRGGGSIFNDGTTQTARDPLI